MGEAIFTPNGSQAVRRDDAVELAARRTGMSFQRTRMERRPHASCR